LTAGRAVAAYITAFNQRKIMPSMPNPQRGLKAGVLDEHFDIVSGASQPDDSRLRRLNSQPGVSSPSL